MELVASKNFKKFKFQSISIHAIRSDRRQETVKPGSETVKLFSEAHVHGCERLNPQWQLSTAQFCDCFVLVQTF